MNLEERRTEVLTTLARCQAPPKFIDLAKQANDAFELKTVLYGYMFYIGQDMESLANAFGSLGNQVESAKTQLEARLAMEPWRIVNDAIQR